MVGAKTMIYNSGTRLLEDRFIFSATSIAEYTDAASESSNGASLGTGTFKPEKNLVFFSDKIPVTIDGYHIFSLFCWLFLLP